MIEHITSVIYITSACCKSVFIGIDVIFDFHVWDRRNFGTACQPIFAVKSGLTAGKFKLVIINC